MRARRLILWLILVLSSLAVAEEPGDPVRYVRRSQTIAEALDQIAGLLGGAEVKSVVFVFEQADFGARERLFDEPDYRAQLAEWLERIDAMAAKYDGNVRIALTGSSKSFAPRAAPALLDEARRAYDVAPEKWLGKLARFAKRRNGAVVYVAGDPVRQWSRAEASPWDPEQVAAVLNRSGTKLYVVMPEARFFEFLPTREFVDLPDSWWRAPMAGVGSRSFHCGWAWETDCPSAYGIAAYVRAAAATRGAYVFYPGRAKDWLDPCPYNAGLLAELVPRMASAADAATAAAADPVLREIMESTRRCKPLAALESDISFLPREAAKLARLAPQARANADLCAAEADRLAAVGRAAEKGELEGASRRSLAQLRYSRFLLETASFHCAAWAEAAGTVEDFVAHGTGRDDYEKSGLRIRLWSEREMELKSLVSPIPEFARSAPDLLPHRRLDDLPPSLRDRAARVVVAAEDVLKHEALSPWGWMVYYGEFVTFAPGWEGEGKGSHRHGTPASEGKSPETPEGPAPAPGSGGSGPTTGG